MKTSHRKQRPEKPEQQQYPAGKAEPDKSAEKQNDDRPPELVVNNTDTVSEGGRLIVLG